MTKTPGELTLISFMDTPARINETPANIFWCVQ